MANFDIASFNLINWANAAADLYDSTPKDVEITQKDETGALFTKTIANRGKFKQQLWDDVGAALGQFNRTFYIDAVNGDDNNDGSSANPFKTFDKFLSIKIPGAAYIIYIKEGQVFEHTVYRNLLSNSVYIGRWGNTSDVSNPKIIFKNDDIQGTHRIGCFNSRLVFYRVDIESESNSNVVSNPAKGCFNLDFSSLGFIICNINLSSDGASFLAISDGYYSAFSAVSFYYSNITTGSGYVYRLKDNAAGSLKQAGTSIDDSTKWVSGIIKDANGVPRNILSNIVF